MNFNDSKIDYKINFETETRLNHIFSNRIINIFSKLAFCLNVVGSVFLVSESEKEPGFGDKYFIIFFVLIIASALIKYLAEFSVMAKLIKTIQSIFAILLLFIFFNYCDLESFNFLKILFFSMFIIIFIYGYLIFCQITLIKYDRWKNEN
ncbi:MAG: hypothetical protein ACRCSK_00955 [Fusobacteriaceae bacterium]